MLAVTARHERAYCTAPHQYGPADRATWHAWATRMRETHELHDCPDCGLPVIWTPIPDVDPTKAGVLDLDGLFDLDSP